jgi:5-methylcytosine-specific restriction endonuclease McrA
MSKSALRSTGSTHRWRQIRSRILRRDQFICQYCNQEATTVDHVIPRRLGGLDSDDNLVASCRRCNLSKGGRFFVSDKTPPTPRSFSNPQNTSIGHDLTQQNPS